MAWIRVTEPVSIAPKQQSQAATRAYDPASRVDDRGYVDLANVEVTNVVLDLLDARSLDLRDCIVSNAQLQLAEATPVEVIGCSIDNGDLSAVTITALRSSTLTEVKLVGTEFSGTIIQDVTFDRCVLRYVNLRTATLTRVRFRDCVLDDVDLYAATLTDVSFDECTLTDVNLDRVKASRVDLRGARSLALKGVSRLNGFLANESQLIGLLHTLAFAAGLDIEQPA